MHEVKYNGKEVSEKFNEVMKKVGNSVDTLLVTTLDDIAWLLNLRGTDIDYNPVFFAYLLFNIPPKDSVDTLPTASLFIDDSKLVDQQVKDHLNANHVHTYGY